MTEKTKNPREELVSYVTKYQNSWVALDSETDEVLASNENLEIVKKQMDNIGKPYYLDKVLPTGYLFIP